MAIAVLVEDDAALAASMRLALEALGHLVRTCETAERALALIGDPAATIEVLVVDVMLPGMDGFEFCRRCRVLSSVPIILLTARGDPIDVVVGLESGADDYVVKPVPARVLDARIKAVLRRAVPTQAVMDAAPRRVGGLVIDELAMRVTRDGVQVALTPTELRLFVELARHVGQVLSRRTLLERVWDYGYTGDARLVDACVQRLRAKVEDDPSHPTLISTVRGVGYRLEPQ